MADLTTAQLTDYLRNIAELESSVYRQEEAKKRIEWEIQWRPKPKAKDSMEEYRPGTVPQKRKSRPAPTYHPPRDGFNIAEGLKGGGFLAIGILLLCTRFTFLKYIGILSVIVGLFFPWMEICRCRDEKEKAEELFDEAKCRHAEYMASIEPEYAKAQQEYDQQMQLYQEKVAAEERRYQADMAEDARNVALAQAEAQRLDAPLAETRELLARYYALDVIYPKYRNMVAMTTIYEYFASGRCTVLTGPAEAAAIGNLLMQAMALGEVHDIMHLRRVVRNSFEVKQWNAQHTPDWDKAYDCLCAQMKEREKHERI